MALATMTLGQAVVTPTAFAAPTTNETISGPGTGKHLWVKVGATTTQITVVRPGNFEAGDAVTDYVMSTLVNVERIIPIIREYRDATAGTATVQFDQVTGVTALLITVRS